jgi:hypothetical protein
MYGLYSRAASNQERLMMARVRYVGIFYRAEEQYFSWVIGRFSSLSFDQVVPYYSQRHLANRNAICILHRLTLGHSVVRCRYLCCSTPQLKLEVLCLLFMKVFPDSKFCK